MRGIAPTPIDERFFRFVAPMMDDRGCWEWTGYFAGPPSARYGYISQPPRQMRRAHRVSWEIHNGPIPNNLCVLHRCDNMACVNPTHLFLGTNSDNTRDMIAKGRHRGSTDEYCLRGHSREEHGVKIKGKKPGQLVWRCRACFRFRDQLKRTSRKEVVS
jgi:hypothetical protein